MPHRTRCCLLHELPLWDACLVQGTTMQGQIPSPLQIQTLGLYGCGDLHFLKVNEANELTCKLHCCLFVRAQFPVRRMKARNPIFLQRYRDLPNSMVRLPFSRWTPYPSCRNATSKRNRFLQHTVFGNEVGWLDVEKTLFAVSNCGSRGWNPQLPCLLLGKWILLASLGGRSRACFEATFSFLAIACGVGGGLRASFPPSHIRACRFPFSGSRPREETPSVDVRWSSGSFRVRFPIEPEGRKGIPTDTMLSE